MINRFVLNEVSYFGPGAREVLPQEINGSADFPGW